MTGILLFASLPLILIAPSQTPASDVILHWAIASHSESDEFVARLYQQKIAPRIVCISTPISWEVYPADFARQHLIELGVPAEAITVLHLPLADCSARHLPDIVAGMKREGWRSALLVSDPAHSRFTAWLAGGHFGRENLSVSVAWSPAEHEDLLRGWWHTHWKAQRMIDAAATAALDLLYAECR